MMDQREQQWQTVPCESASCIEFEHSGDAVHIRTTTDPTRVITVSVDEWQAMVTAVRGGWGDL